MDLSKYEVKTHPFKGIFKKLGVANGTIANYLGLSYTYVNNMLNGHYRMPAHIIARLQDLIDKLEAGKKQKGFFWRW